MGAPQAVAPARPMYVDVAAAAGLGDFLHAGFLGNHSTPPDFVEAMATGVCWLDHDTDGRLDLYVVNGRYHSQPERNARDPTSRLFRNAGGGLVDVTEAAGVGLRGYGMGCSAADYDNDADADLVVTSYGGLTLFRNDGGAFTNVTSALGLDVRTCGAFPCWNTAATWLDADRDGCLDLYVGRFGNWTIGSGLQNGPDQAPEQANAFYRGACGAAFTDATAASGLLYHANTWSSGAYDVNGDGWTDLYDSNDRDRNALWLNDGDGTFTRAVTNASDPRAGMGTAIGDLDHDGRPDIVTTNFVNEDNGIWMGRASGDFVDVGADVPFRDSRPYSGWAASILDFDHDGRNDLMIVNGLTENITRDVPTLLTEEPIHLFRHTASGFVQANATMGPALARNYVGRAAAWADFDDDGDLDVALAEAGEAPAHLLRSDRPPGNFLVVELVGNAPGVARDALGARVTLQAAGLPPTTRDKSPQLGFLGSGDPRLHFGLADARDADLTLRWPDGSTQQFPDVPANAFVRIVQGDAAPTVLARRPIASASGDALVQRLADATFHAALDAPVASAAWDFGDGARAACVADVCTDETGAVIGAIDDRNVTLTHAFAATGPYEIHVALQDAAGKEAARRIVGQVAATLVGEVAFTRAEYAPSDVIEAVARVRYETGEPVEGATVRLTLNHTFWPLFEENVLPLLPRGAHAPLGYKTETLEGTTGADGTVRIEIPMWWRSPAPAVPVAFHPPGDYRAVMDATYRGGEAAPAEAGYRVFVE